MHGRARAVEALLQHAARGAGDGGGAAAAGAAAYASLLTADGASAADKALSFGHYAIARTLLTAQVPRRGEVHE